MYSTGRTAVDETTLDMPQKIALLEEQLTQTNDIEEQLQLMFQLIDFLGVRDINAAHWYALQAVQLAEQLRHPRYIAQSLYHLGVVETPLVKTPKIHSYLQRALGMWNELGDDVMCGKVLHLIANLHLEKGEQDKALGILLANIKRFETHQQTHWLLHSLIGASALYKQQGDFSLALHYLFRATRAVEHITPPVRYNQWMSTCCYHLAIVYAMLEEKDKSLDMFLKSLQLRRENGERMAQAGILHGLGTLLMTMQRYDEAYNYLQETLDILRNIAPNKSLEVHCLVSLGIVMEGKNSTERAIVYYKRALALGHSYEVGNDACCRALQQLAGIYRMHQNYEKAIRWLKKALATARRAGLRQNEYTIIKDMAEIYEQLNDMKRALYYHKQYAEQKESVFGIQQQKAITAEQVKFAVSKEQTEKEKYRSEKEQLAVEVERKKQELVKTSLQLAQKTEFLKQVKKQVRDMLRSRNGKAILLRHLLQEIQQNVVSEQEWQLFEQQLEQTNDEFIGRLVQRFPYLTPAELKVCALLKVNMNTKEIARMLSLSGRTVDFHRNNIRKKTGIDNSTSFAAFFAAL